MKGEFIMPEKLNTEILMMHEKDIVYSDAGIQYTMKDMILSILKLHRLYTHCGTHHADDVTSTAFMIELHSLVYQCFCLEYDYRNFVKRIVYVSPSMKEEERNGSAIVYDIGYGEFDHHDKDHLKLRPPKNIKDKINIEIPYASLGLLWKKYGRMYLILSYLIRYGEYPNSELVEKHYRKFDNNIILPIDARDNGIFDLTDSNYSDTIANFNAMRSLNMSDFASNRPLTGIFANITNDPVFNYACDFADRAFTGWICNTLKEMKDSEYLTNLLENHDPTNSVLVMNHYVKIEESVASSHPEIHYYVYPSARDKGLWCIRSVQKNKISMYPFNMDKKPLYGTGVTYIHPSGFLANASSLENAIDACKTNDAMLEMDEKSIIIPSNLYFLERKEVS